MSIFCQGTQFQVCVLLDTAGQPKGSEVLEALTQGWTTWAGYPERGLVADRAKPFLSLLANDLADHGCTFTTAAKASPWQIGQIERHGGLWKETFRRVCWAHQVQGKQDVLFATASVNQAKNALVRKGGFSPAQWVLGRDIRIPASLQDDHEVMRVGAQALASTPNSIFYKKTQLRMAAREAFSRAATSSSLRRAELRQVRPSRGPFLPGMYVFYYDASDREPSPNCWRGIARVIGKEGSSTIWISHRGLLLAVSPEHLSRAYDPEVEHWTVTARETELMDSAPAAGGTGFIDLRKSPIPKEIDDEQIAEEDEEDLPEPSIAPADEGPPIMQPDEMEEERVPECPIDDLSSSSTSMARMHLESERERKKQLRSFEFFDSKQKQRRLDKEQRPQTGGSLAEAASIPIPEDAEFDPEVHDYHQSQPSRRQISPYEEDPTNEANEREAKRLRIDEPSGRGLFSQDDVTFAFMAVEVPGFLHEQARSQYQMHQSFYQHAGINMSEFMFGVKRNDFYERYEALSAQSSTAGGKKKGRKEIKLSELSPQQQLLFTGDSGSDEKEWKAWQSKEAVDILGLEESKQIRKQKPHLIVPTRWVRTNKNDGLVGKDFLAKSRLVVQGFKDRSLGEYRRDAPTASAIAESICLAVCAFYKFTLVAKDIKNAYFSGKSVGREIYLDLPRGGLPGLRPGQLLKARKAIYGFAEAARMFWLALREHLESDGWRESKLEPALFYLRSGSQLRGILVTHVDDIEGGLHHSVMNTAFSKSSLALEFATNHVRDFIFRGREVKQTSQGHIDISMRNYALSMKSVQIARDRRKQLESDLTEEEMEQMNSVAGELGWIARQLRCDLTYENGVIQRCKSEACVADLIKLKQYVGQAKRGADFRLRYWSDVDLRNGVILHLADSGHANGTPERNEQMRYRSVGGYFILIADRRILDGDEVRCNILTFHSGQTKRVCRSTLAAEASHLAEAVESGDWITVLLEEALTGNIDLKNWSKVIEQRQRVYITDARSVFDYLQKDATSTSTDKRMAIEGALLRETVRKDGASVRWIDGMQNIANVLTKHNAEKDTLREFLRTGMMTLQQSELNKQMKEKQREARQRRSQQKREDTTLRDEQRKLRRQQAAKEVEQYNSDVDE